MWLDEDFAAGLVLAVEVIADAKRGNITQLENVFSSLTQPLVCFGQAALRKRLLSRFSQQNRRTVGPPLCLPPLTVQFPNFCKKATRIANRFYTSRLHSSCVDVRRLIWTILLQRWTNPGCDDTEEAWRFYARPT